jgi:hypothetical protein
MKRKLLSSAAALLLAAPAFAGPKTAPEPAQWLPIPAAAQKNIKKGTIEVYTPVTGVTTAQDTYDVFAPFDGRVEDIQVELFDFVKPKTLLARMVSTEMAALLDSSTEGERRQTEQHWEQLYKFFPISPKSEGIITNIYVSPKSRVNKGDRLFTVARKVVVIGRNTEPLYDPLAKGMTAELLDARDQEKKLDTVLADFIPMKSAPRFSRLWLDVTDISAGIKIGQQFDGRLFVGKSEDTMLVPRGDLIEYGGRRFMVTEVTTGLETVDEVELLGHTSIYLGRAPSAQGESDGTTEKDR